ncbi:unnamed protein product, partial [Scytosiphon promiscuus]
GDVAEVGSSSVEGAAGSRFARRQGKGKARAVGGRGTTIGGGGSNGAGGTHAGDVLDVTGDSAAEDQAGTEPEGASAGGSGRGDANHRNVASAASTESSSSGGDGGTTDAREAEEEDEEMEDAPGDGDPDRISVRFQLPTGARVTKAFRKSSSVRQLFLCVRSELEGAKSKAFDVRTLRPPSSVRCVNPRSFIPHFCCDILAPVRYS